MSPARTISEEECRQAVEKFRNDGCTIIPELLSEEEVEKLRAEMHRLVDDMDPVEQSPHIFSTSSHAQATDEYFLNSSDKIRYFYEEGAVDSTGSLVVEKRKALNKVGHGLHFLNPVFRDLTFSEPFKKIVREIGYIDPRVVQSMYIFKQPKIGGVVVPHYDATFLYVEPIEHLLGIWIAIDDATEENGCLHFVPGSHKGNPADYRFVRGKDPTGSLLEFQGNLPPFETGNFVPAPVKKGSVVLIHGLVWHKSEPNTSSKSRHAYTFHIVEQAGTKWSPDNWLQLRDSHPFPSLYSGPDSDLLSQG